MDISDIEYACSGDLNIAYQRYGAGPDVVMITPTGRSPAATPVP